MSHFVAREGWIIIFITSLSLLLLWASWHFSFIIFLFLLALLLLFRTSRSNLVCADEKATLAPIGGRIMRTENVYYEDLGECLEINIKNAFYHCGNLNMSIKIRLEKLTLRYGLFLCSELEVVKKTNERMIIRAFAGDKNIIMRICAGSLDRKLKPINDPRHLNTGGKVGLLFNGSVSLFLPKDTRVHVDLNDEIKAGLLLAYLSQGLKMSHKPQLVYILPNLFTAASAFLGVISIISSTRGDFEKALIYIILSLLFDGLDGRIARLTSTTSKLGVEFDSLADLVAFGVAPVVLFYMSIGVYCGKFGSLIAAFLVVFGAIRLVRFNVTTGTYEPSVFIGLPIPTAAIVSVIYTHTYLGYDFLKAYGLLFVVLQAILGISVVNNIRYPSFKKLSFNRSSALKVLVFLMIPFSFLYLYPLESLVTLASLHVTYGILRFFLTFFGVRKKTKD